MNTGLPELPPGYFWRMSRYFDAFMILELRKRLLLGSRQIESTGIPAFGWGSRVGGRGRYGTGGGRNVVDYIDNDVLLDRKIREAAENMLRKVVLK